MTGCLIVLPAVCLLLLPSASCPCLLSFSARAPLGDAADARDAFFEAFERGRVGHAYEAVAAEARAVCDDGLRLLQKFVGELGGTTHALAVAAAHFGEGVESAFGF